MTPGAASHQAREEPLSMHDGRLATCRHRISAAHSIETSKSSSTDSRQCDAPRASLARLYVPRALRAGRRIRGPRVSGTFIRPSPWIWIELRKLRPISRPYHSVSRLLSVLLTCERTSRNIIPEYIISFSDLFEDAWRSPMPITVEPALKSHSFCFPRYSQRTCRCRLIEGTTATWPTSRASWLRLHYHIWLQ
jgi:hypothetical protein